jgi:hypothetical protein
MLTTRNKLNLVENHQLTTQKHHHELTQLEANQQRVRQAKQREEKELREIKEQLRRNKENERLLIRNSSLQHEQTIRKNREIELMKKEKMVKEIHLERQNYKQSLLQSRIQEYPTFYADTSIRNRNSSTGPSPKSKGSRYYRGNWSNSSRRRKRSKGECSRGEKRRKGCGRKWKGSRR